MAISRQKKKEIIEKISNIVKTASSVVFVNFHGLGVADTNEIRKTLKERGVTYTVTKKTLVKRAIADTKVKGDMPDLEGELSLAFSDDLIAPAREIYPFIKKFKDNLSILGGIFEGRFLSKEEMEEIASIPPLEVLYGQFVNVINSPIAGIVMTLDQIAKTRD